MKKSSRTSDESTNEKVVEPNSRSEVMVVLSAFAVGVLFSLGLGFAGMTQPQKVIGFLNVADWDPALFFVMAGAVGTHALLYPLVRKRQTPVFDATWHVPTRRDLSARLVIGSVIFGVGWGLAGYCPGPAVTALASLASGDVRPLVFVASMVVGMVVFQKTARFLPSHHDRS